MVVLKLTETIEDMVAAKKISMHLSFSGGIARINVFVEKQYESYAFLAQITKQVSDLGFEIFSMEINGFTMTKVITVDEFAVLYKIWSS
jgi:hypothetical protein